MYPAGFDLPWLALSGRKKQLTLAGYLSSNPAFYHLNLAHNYHYRNPPSHSFSLSFAPPTGKKQNRNDWEGGIEVILIRNHDAFN